jgi:DNA invertase Pin-like site-specific DNA recombinase
MGIALDPRATLIEPLLILDLIERISEAGAAFRSLGDPLWDTTSSHGKLLRTLLAAIAEFERDLIRERTGDGRKRAMAAGVKFGRKPKLSDYQRAEAIKRRTAGKGWPISPRATLSISA